MKRAALVALAIAACKGGASAPPDDRPSGSAVPGAPDTAPPADWKPIGLADVAKAGFATRGILRVPPGATIGAGGRATASGASDAAYARITLPDGKHVTVLERHAGSTESPDELVATLARVGMRVLLQEHGATWFAVGTDMGNAGLGVQCETWGARPGVSLGVEEPVDAAGYKTFVRICASLTAAP